LFYKLMDLITMAPLGGAAYFVFMRGEGINFFCPQRLMLFPVILQIDPIAGFLLTPFALWTGFYTVLTYWISKMNTSDASERSTL
uniref:C4-dicarboxylate ABC transporter permease n=1 Tax=Gongylonema pulchrum TaxID=637853 RepID=A0A183E261_9BILA